ncbi:putative phage cell wall peptidase, NlpC/P60 family [Salinihabitans flavidus]|uniref:Putative phage cell wall peptidase, NlpC/P60 family n=1 Tax=Salinihabitans flavidus TaxID=569882 RepID=A0A1H8QA15_9RHOB|nr:NlpC/P60 family protein [Salinihabitans flavidus]SEO50858.1 putative phage cell wall peptidase, NlpC/P60 family [Salinihabitans flavidus]
MSGANGARVVAIARSWVGTPYRHQTATRSAGTDCLGLLRGIWRTLYGAEPEAVPAYSMDWSEPQGQKLLWDAARRHLIEKDLTSEAAGDVLLFRMRRSSVAKHLGIAGEIGGRATFIHAYSGHAVLESPLSSPWRRRIVARFEFPKEVG